ncbi:MAG: hypothetical protein ACYDB8_03175 [Acidiferrobacterales bacterium]
MDEAHGWLMAADRLVQGLCHERLGHARSERIAHHLAAAEILEGHEIQETLG